VAHHRQTVANLSHDKGRGSPEPKGWGSGQKQLGLAALPSTNTAAAGLPVGVSCFPSPRRGCTGWLDRLCDCSRSHGRLSLSAPHTAPNSSDFCPCSPHSSSAWTSLPQSLPRSREHRVSRAHQPFPLLFPPTGALWAGTDLRRVCTGAWHRVGTRPGTRQALSQ